LNCFQKMNLSKKQLFLLGFLICSIFALCIGLTVWGVRKECKPASRYQTILKKIKEASAQNKLFFVSQDGRMVATFDMNSPDLAKIIAIENLMNPLPDVGDRNVWDVKIFLDYPWTLSSNQPKDTYKVFTNTAILPFTTVLDNLSNDEYFNTNVQVKNIYEPPSIVSQRNHDEFIVGSFLYYDKDTIFDGPPLSRIATMLYNLGQVGKIVDHIQYEIKYKV